MCVRESVCVGESASVWECVAESASVCERESASV